jgi:hypothetical protein
MKNIAIHVTIVFLLTMLVACVGNGPASPSDRETIGTIVAETLTASASATLVPSPTASRSQPSHEYMVYGVKTVAYSMGGDEAFQQNLSLYQYINQHTDIFSYSLVQHATNLIFSDKSLPIFILNTSGGGETAIHDIVAASPSSGKLYARMLPRDQYTSYQDAGALYELSTDGTNSYRKIFDFDSPVDFVLSPDGTKIAYISYNFLVVRALDSGDEIGRMDLDEYKYNWISKISWAPDSKTILMNVAAGEASYTPVAPYSQTNGCYLVNIYDKIVTKFRALSFQYPMELMPGFMTDPYSYAYFPRSNRLIGIARKYDQAYYVVELFSVDLEGSNLIEIPIGHNEAVWEVNISPNEQYIAYPCMQAVCVTHIQDSLSEVASQPLPAEAGADQEQTVIGWLEK